MIHESSSEFMLSWKGHHPFKTIIEEFSGLKKATVRIHFK